MFFSYGYFFIVVPKVMHGHIIIVL